MVIRLALPPAAAVLIDVGTGAEPVVAAEPESVVAVAPEPEPVESPATPLTMPEEPKKQEPEKPKKEGGRSILGPVLLGGTVAAFAGSGVGYFLARDSYNEFWDTRNEASRADLEALQSKTNTFTVVWMGGLVVTGALGVGTVFAW